MGFESKFLQHYRIGKNFDIVLLYVYVYVYLKANVYSTTELEIILILYFYMYTQNTVFVVFSLINFR
jgi:hypothetical protein